MNNNKETERAELHKTIWRIANDLRGSVDGWDFKTYVTVYPNPHVEASESGIRTNPGEVFGRAWVGLRRGR